MKKQFINAKIYTVDNSFSTANSMVIEDEKIIFVGQESDYDGAKPAEIIDCDGAFIYPGFIDPHCHFIDLGRTYYTASLHGSKSFDAVIDCIQQFQQNNQSDFLLGRGWDQNLWSDKNLPTKNKLDELFADLPVFLIRIDSHVALLNQAALDYTNILDKSFADEGFIEMNNGQPTGIIFDKALFYILSFLQENEIKKTEMILKAQEVCFQYGLTSIGDAYMEYPDFLLFKQLYEMEQLKIKIYGMLIPSEENKTFLTNHKKFRSNRFHIGATKHFADGALGSRGAALLEPYSDDINTKGLLLESNAYREREAQFCIDNQVQMITHCIGDAANKRIVELYKKFLGGKNELRWRIEHVQLIEDDLIKMFSENNIIPSIQSTHGTSDFKWAKDRLGEHRMRNAYRIKDLLNQTGIIINGSDFPIEKPNPLRGFYASITRKNDAGESMLGFASSQKISRVEALKSMTIWAAYAQFEEHEKGSIEKDKKADFVICTSDLLVCDEAEILSTKIISTYVEGELVYQPKSTSYL